MKPVAISSARPGRDAALQDRATAFHEAAHCVVGYCLGWTLTPGLGVCIGDAPICWMRMPASDKNSFGEAQQALAGWLAETILVGIDHDSSNEELLDILSEVEWGEGYEEGDEHIVFRVLLARTPKASDDELVRNYRELSAQTLAILSETAVWSAIERLAEALLVEQHIRDPDAVERIIGPNFSWRVAAGLLC